MEWKEVDICQLCDSVSETYKGNASEVVLINTSDVLDGKCLNHEYVPNKKLKGQFKKTFRKGDILYSEIRPANKRFCFVDFEPKDYIASTKLMVLRAHEDVDPQYLYQILRSNDTLAQLQMLAESRSGTFPQITYSELSNIMVSLPSQKAQKNIVSILSCLDRKIELNNKINADLEEMAQAIFKNWFVDFEPFKDGKFVDSELGMIPEGWKVGSPYEYVKVVYGAPYKSAKFNDNGEGLPLIRIRDLKDCNPQFYTPEILPQTEYVNMGDIVAGMDAEFVPHIWKGNTGLLNQRVCKLMPQQTSISNLFVLYLMKPELEFVQSYKTGTTVSHLGKADIDKFVVVLPPLKVVEECSKILDSILQRIKNISAESRNLSLLRDTLLPRLMSGELEVPE